MQNTSSSNMPMEDGLALMSSKHPRPPFWKRLWQMIKSWFIRPKFSRKNLEPAEKVEISNEPLTLEPKPPTVDLRTFNRKTRRFYGNKMHMKIPGVMQPDSREKRELESIKKAAIEDIKSH